MGSNPITASPLSPLGINFAVASSSPPWFRPRRLFYLGWVMNADTFIYEMQRWEEVIAENPEMLAEFANQPRLLDNLEGLQRDIDHLAATLKRTNQ